MTVFQARRGYHDSDLNGGDEKLAAVVLANRRTHGSAGGPAGGRTYGRAGGLTYGPAGGSASERTDVRAGGWTDGRAGRRERMGVTARAADECLKMN